MKMKILFIITSSSFGGTENHLLNLIKSLTNAGVEVGIVCPKGGIFTEKENVYYLDIKKEGFFKSLSFISKVIKKFRPNLIHTHLTRASYIGLTCKILYNIPIVATVHNLLGRSKAFNYSSNALFPENTDMAFKLIIFFGGKLIAVSNCIKEALVADKIDASKVQVISNGTHFADMPVSQRNNEFRSKYGINENHILVGVVGSVKKGKGQILAVQALNLLPDEIKDRVRLVLIGKYNEDNYKQSIDDYVSENNLQKNVIFAGVQTNMIDVYADIDIFLHPSYSEACSMAVIEAMAEAKPIVLSNIPANSAIIDDGINGCLVELNPSDIEAALLKLISNDELRKSLSSNAREKAVNFYSLEKMTANYIAFYKSNIKQTN